MTLWDLIKTWMVSGSQNYKQDLTCGLPPAAAQVAVEELRKARHKRHFDSFQGFVYQNLLKYEWVGQLYKVSGIGLETTSFLLACFLS